MAPFGDILHSPHASSKETAMQLVLETPRFALEPGQVVSLDDACGALIQPAGGRLWITEEGECKDFVVRPGETFVISRAGRTVVQAVEHAWVTLREGTQPCVANDRQVSP
jgi:Protein of unknown function (DUF2917)